MVLLAGSTGLRRSEMIALTWADLDARTMEVKVLRSCVRNRFGDTKTESSHRPAPLHPIELNAFLNWRAESPYTTDLLFLRFASKATNLSARIAYLRRVFGLH